MDETLAAAEVARGAVAVLEDVFEGTFELLLDGLLFDLLDPLLVPLLVPLVDFFELDVLDAFCCCVVSFGILFKWIIKVNDPTVIVF